MPSPEPLRSRDSDVLRSALRRLRSSIDVPVVFGGMDIENGPIITELFGTRTKGLRGLLISPHAGLGGRVWVEGVPRGVADYRTARTISHDYDGPVLGEGITSILALPIRVFDRPRGLVYLGTRESAPLGERLITAARPFVTAVEQEVRIRDEVDRRIAAASRPNESVTQQELASLREVQAELRSLVAEADGTALGERLRAIVDSLVAAPPAERLLTVRETDVLSLVALGCGNSEVATRLGLSTETVRSYLRNAMRKLDAHTRGEAVSRARRRGELV